MAATATEDTETGFVRTNGVDTYYERRGDGLPVVFVHAAIVDHAFWRPQFEGLADEHTVVAYDVRGHGRTGGSARGTYSVELFADDLAALVEGLGLDRPVVVGGSTGGCIAQSFAVRHPDSLSGLVLVDTFSPVALDWRDRAQMLALRGTVLPVRLFGIRRVQAAQTWMQDRLLSPGSRGEYATIEQLQAEMPQIPADEFAKIVRAVAGFLDADLPLESVSVPTLVLSGERTVGTVRRHVAVFEARIPDVTALVVPGGGHACNLDSPAVVTDAVREHVARCVGD